MSHTRSRSRFGQDKIWFIRKPVNLEVGDWVLTHGDGKTSFPQKIILIDGEEVVFSGGKRLNKRGILARIAEGNVNNAPRGVAVAEIKCALLDYGRLRVQTYADWAMELKEEKDNG